MPKLMTIYKQMKTTIGRFYFAGHFMEGGFILLGAFWKAVLFCWALLYFVETLCNRLVTLFNALLSWLLYTLIKYTIDIELKYR